MSLLGTCNFTGYMVAVLLSAIVVRRYGQRRTITAGLMLIGICMTWMSQCNHFGVLFALFALAGFGSGLSTIPMLSLIAPWFSGTQRGRATGLVLCGNGFGISLAGCVVARLDRTFANHGWQIGWLLFGVICLLVSAIAGIFLRNHPEEMGLAPVGECSGEAANRIPKNENCRSISVLVRLSTLFFIFGLASTIYGTFIVTSMIHEYGLSGYRAGVYWSLVGFFSIFSSICFGYLSDRIGRKYGIVLVFSVHAIAYALAGFKLGLSGLVVSVFLFGISIFGAPAVLTAAIGDSTNQSDIANAMAIANFLFALGQSLGPVAAVAAAGSRGVFTVSYLYAAIMAIVAALLALTLP
jgi:sugar phosphate permease